MSTSRTGTWSDGFTLVETLVVISILALLLSITYPNLRALYRTDLDRAAMMLASTIQHLHSEAVSKNRFHRLNFDLERGEYWVTIPRADGPQDSTLLKPARLPGDIHILEVSASGQPSILFSPLGWTQRATIRLEDEEGRQMVLTTVPLTGRVKLSGE